jgi:hypothetical protein
VIEVNAANAAEVAAKVKNGELPGPAKSLAEAMHRVMEAVDYVQKTGRITVGQGYSFAGEAAFIAKIRPELVRHGIVLAPVAMEPLVSEVFAGKSGPQNRVVLRVTFRFTHWPTGQTLDVVTCGEGMDNGDKATNKAQTGAMKYCLRQAFVIETGNDPDETPSSEQERAASSPAPRQNAPAATARKDNPNLRAQVAQAFAQCQSRADYLRICTRIKDDVSAGVLSQADRDALAPIARETGARFPAEQPAK